MTQCKECCQQVDLLRKEMLEQMEELKSIIRFAMVSSSSTDSSLTIGTALRTMTSKQHAAMQMWLFSGMKIADIGRRMNCSRNTARLHVKALWTKMGTEDKSKISSNLIPVFDAVSDAEYMEWSGGLPKNWAATYDEGRIDPYLNLYVKSKENTYERGKT